MTTLFTHPNKIFCLTSAPSSSVSLLSATTSSPGLIVLDSNTLQEISHEFTGQVLGPPPDVPPDDEGGRRVLVSDGRLLYVVRQDTSNISEEVMWCVDVYDPMKGLKFIRYTCYS